MRFYRCIRPKQRKIPSSFRDVKDSPEKYHAYGEKHDPFEMWPRLPLPSFEHSQYVGQFPRWLSIKAITRCFVLDTFYSGHLDEDYTWKALQGIIQGQQDHPRIRETIECIAEIPSRLYERMITIVIMPVTLSAPAFYLEPKMVLTEIDLCTSSRIPHGQPSAHKAAFGHSP